MDHTPTFDTLLQSCTVLFGTEPDISREFLDYLQISGVKKAFRQKAKETHPDLACHFSEDIRNTAPDRFHCVRESYENLKEFIRNRDDSSSSRAQSPLAAETYGWQGSEGRSRTFNAASYSTADTCSGYEQFELQWDHRSFPSRKLMLGDFLYFAGIVEWQEIIRALVWQKASRPRFGDLGCSLGMLQHKDIQRIFKFQRPGRLFGEVAVQLGLLDKQQRDRLVFYQKCKQQRIGQYFIEKRFFSNNDLLLFINMLRNHNAFHPNRF